MSSSDRPTEPGTPVFRDAPIRDDAPPAYGDAHGVYAGHAYADQGDDVAFASPSHEPPAPGDVLEIRKILRSTSLLAIGMCLLGIVYGKANPPQAVSPPPALPASHPDLIAPDSTVAVEPRVDFDGLTVVPVTLPYSETTATGYVPHWVIGLAPQPLRPSFLRNADKDDDGDGLPQGDGGGSEAKSVAETPDGDDGDIDVAAAPQDTDEGDGVPATALDGEGDVATLDAAAVPADPDAPSPNADVAVALATAGDNVPATALDDDDATPGIVGETDRVAASPGIDSDDAALFATPTPATPPAPSPETGLIQERRLHSFPLRYAAVRGNPVAQYYAAAAYRERQDAAAAVYWFRRSARQDYAPAQYQLAKIYESGLGVPIDRAAARRWYAAAAAGGNRDAMHNLAVLFSVENGGSPDPDKSRYWFNRAARLGVRDSQFNLGVIHQIGLGVKPNPAIAYMWFAIAERQGDTGARSYLETLERQMSEKARLDAQKRADNFITVAPSRAANIVPPIATVSEPNATLSDPGITRHVQNLLSLYGYDIGEVDGVLGPLTAGAIGDFRSQTNLNPAVESITVALIDRLERDLP